MLFNSIKKFALPALRLFIRYSLNHGASNPDLILRRPTKVIGRRI
jgi:hypothetical protein